MNSRIEALISRMGPGSTLVIADRGFPYWPNVETVDISLVDDIPTVLDVLRVLRMRLKIARIYMASEFRGEFSCEPTPVVTEPHVDFKRRVPEAVGLIRTGDTIQYANLIIEAE